MSSSEEEESSSDEYETDEEVVVTPAPKAGGGKDAQPCKHYRVDTTAAKFGLCKCGWPKAAHEGPKANKAAEALARLRSGKYEPQGAPSTDGVCNKFRVDVNASEFGVCANCGRKQKDHRAQNVNPARAALKSLKSVKVNTSAGDHVAINGKACKNYAVDPNGKRFGDCLCGFSKADHKEKDEDPAAAMLRKLKEKNKSAREREDQLAAGLVQDEDEQADESTPLNKKKSKKQSSKGGTDGEDPSGEESNAGKGCCVVM